MMVCLSANTTASQNKCIRVRVWLFLSYILIVFTLCHSVRSNRSHEKQFSNISVDKHFQSNWTTYTTINYDGLSPSNGSIGSAIEPNKSLQLSLSPAANESNVCKVCWCSKKDTLDCRRADQLDSLPAIPLRTDRLFITEM